MTQEKTNQLLQRYMDGLTTRDEERQLRELLNAADAPREWDVYRLMLSPLPPLSDMLPQEDVDAEYERMVSERGESAGAKPGQCKTSKLPHRRTLWWRTVGIAACVAVVVGMAMTWKGFTVEEKSAQVVEPEGIAQVNPLEMAGAQAESLENAEVQAKSLDKSTAQVKSATMVEPQATGTPMPASEETEQSQEVFPTDQLAELPQDEKHTNHNEASTNNDNVTANNHNEVSNNKNENDMNRIGTMITGLAMTVASTAQTPRAEAGVTFTVDENLTFIEEPYDEPIDAKQVLNYVMRERGADFTQSSLMACSFANEKLHLASDDPFYQTFIKAYAQHRPLILSPDMIWLNISQVFGLHVSINAETLRNQFVDHDGTKLLTVVTDKDMELADAPWDEVLEGFGQLIETHTKGDIAKNLTANFSTTGLTERVASNITLMAAMKPYFEYKVMRMVCGIPSITLTGTADDWKRVLAKTEALAKYDFEWYVKDMRPILKQFIKAAQGKPNRKFWKDIVMRDRPDRLRGGGCSMDPATAFDGWFTKMFPYGHDGKRLTADDYYNGRHLMPEFICVDFIYEVVDGLLNPLSTTPMQLWAGFIGIESDPTTHALRPKIGWMVMKAKEPRLSDNPRP